MHLPCSQGTYQGRKEKAREKEKHIGGTIRSKYVTGDGRGKKILNTFYLPCTLWGILYAL